MVVHRDHQSRRQSDGSQNVGTILARIHKSASMSLYYVNHMLTKRRLLKHELDDAILTMKKAASDLEKLREDNYGDDV